MHKLNHPSFLWFPGQRLRIALFMLLAFVGFGGQHLAFSLQPKANAEEDLSEVGLNGIIGEPASPELDTQFLANDLPETWKSWAESLDEEMLVYLFPEELDVKAQRELIAKLRERVKTMRWAIADPRYRPIRDRLISLAEPLSRHLDLSTAILDSLELGIVPVSRETRNQALEQLKTVTNTLSASLANRPDGAAWSKDLELAKLSGMLSDRNTPTMDLQNLLEAILKRMEPREEYSADQLRLLRSDVVWEFHKSAARIHDILAWEHTRPTTKTLRAALKQLAVAFVSLDVNYLPVHIENLQLATNKLILLNPANGPKFAFLKEQVLADNVHTFVSESVMQELVYDRRSESGQINETILGAQVHGSQVTETETTLDLVPSPEEALMAVKVAGNINANTVAVAGCIKVYTQSHSQFWAEKRAQFDGFRFQSSPAQIAVNANTNPYAADTPISCLPILGNCTENVVICQANARKAQAEAMGRQRVADRALPELNEKLDDSLDQANADLADKTYRRLSNNNLYPVAMRTATTDTHFLSATLIRNMAELGGGPVPGLFNESTGANFHIHESLLNNIADRMNLAGRTMTDAEVREEFRRFILELTGTVVDVKKADAEPEGQTQDRFVFDKTTPLRCQIRNNQIRLTVRTALIRANGDMISMHDITIPLEFTLQDEDILISTGQAAAQRVGMVGGVGENAIMADKVSKSIEDGRRSRLMTWELEDGKSLTLRTERIKALNGWLSIWALPSKPAPPKPPMAAN